MIWPRFINSQMSSLIWPQPNLCRQVTTKFTSTIHERVVLVTFFAIWFAVLNDEINHLSHTRTKKHTNPRRVQYRLNITPPWLWSTTWYTRTQTHTRVNITDPCSYLIFFQQSHKNVRKKILRRRNNKKIVLNKHKTSVENVCWMDNVVVVMSKRTAWTRSRSYQDRFPEHTDQVEECGSVNWWMKLFDVRVSFMHVCARERVYVCESIATDADALVRWCAVCGLRVSHTYTQ